MLKRLIPAVSLFVLLHTNIVQAEELVIYSSDAFPPQIYLANGEPTGFVPALFKHLSAETGDTYRFILLPWKRAISESSLGHGGIVNFSLTEERQRDFDFSDPIYENRVELVVLKQRAAEFRTIEDMKGRTFGVPNGARFGADFEDKVNQKVYKLEPDPQPLSRVTKLLLGRIDVAVLGQSYLNYSAKSDLYLQANRDKLTVLPFPLIQDLEYLAFPKSMNRQPALKRFNKALAAFRKTKEYQQLESTYFSN